MKQSKNRERILRSSIQMFNENGVATLSTNHISQNLKISPGNLYFHFKNKEEIIRELFQQMCEETYVSLKVTEQVSPEVLISGAMEVFWKFRFFHREMYYLKRKDPELARMWKKHIHKTLRLLKMAYSQWIKVGIMARIRNTEELQFISDSVLFTGSAFMEFFESKQKPATRRPIGLACQHLMKILKPYLINK